MLKQYKNMNIRNSDWLSRFFLFTKVTPIKSATLYLIIYAIFSIFLAFEFDAWLPNNTRRGFSNDIPSLAFGFILQPVIIGAYCWIQYAIDQMFYDLKNIFSDTKLVEQEFDNIKYKLQHKLLSPCLTVLAIVLSTLFVLAFINIIPTPVPVWLTANPAIAITLSPFYFVSAYAFMMFLYDLFITFNTLNKLMRLQKIHVTVLHPDEAGGLGSIGRFISNLSYVMAAIGITLLISTLYDFNRVLSGQDYALVIYILVYIFLIPFMFFQPLWITHIAMVKARADILLKLSKELNVLYSKLTSHPKPSKKTSKLYEEIKQLEEIYNLTKMFPTWPFNSGNIRKYFGISLSPFISIVFPIVQEIFNRFASK